MQSENMGKVILISIGVTMLIGLSGIFIFREALVSYLAAMLQNEIVSKEVSRAVETTDANIPDMIEQVNPAVVSIVITKDVPVYEQYYETFNPGGYWGGFSIPRIRENGTEQREVGGGSGFIVSNDGMIVTNRHVVEDVDAAYTVLLNDGTTYAVEVLARDPQLDIAILRIAEPIKSALTYVTFGDSQSLRLGETVVAIGNALAEFRNSVSVGVVSGLARSIVASTNSGKSEHLDQVIQTDAAINPGNSGGPLLNVAGEVVGVNVATSRGADNIGFALPAHSVRSVVESVREHGKIIRPFLGVRYTQITEQIAKQNNLTVTYGALITRGALAEELAVMPGSPADIAGITENTILLEIDGVKLMDIDLASVLRTKKVGDEVELLVLQRGQERLVTVTLEAAE